MLYKPSLTIILLTRGAQAGSIFWGVGHMTLVLLNHQVTSYSGLRVKVASELKTRCQSSVCLLNLCGHMCFENQNFHKAGRSVYSPV